MTDLRVGVAIGAIGAALLLGLSADQTVIAPSLSGEAMAAGLVAVAR